MVEMVLRLRNQLPAIRDPYSQAEGKDVLPNLA